MDREQHDREEEMKLVRRVGELPGSLRRHLNKTNILYAADLPRKEDLEDMLNNPALKLIKLNKSGEGAGLTFNG